MFPPANVKLMDFYVGRSRLVVRRTTMKRYSFIGKSEGGIRERDADKKRNETLIELKNYSLLDRAINVIKYVLLLESSVREVTLKFLTAKFFDNYHGAREAALFVILKQIQMDIKERDKI